MAITESELAQLTARAGVGRAGTMRAGVAPKAYEMKADGSGQIIWNRDLPRDGEPGNPVTWTTGRE